MTHLPASEFRAVQTVHVVGTAQFRVINGVHHGDPIDETLTPCPGDVYALDALSDTHMLPLRQAATTRQTASYTVTSGSQTEAEGTTATLLWRLTFMTQIGVPLEAYVIACASTPQDAPRCYIYATTPIAPKTAYTLLKAEAAPDHLPSGQGAGMCFGRGTYITLANGEQKRVEDLTPGTRIMTRDNGEQTLKWASTRTVQAVGAFAPVVITKGTLGNTEDLLLGQHHRLLISDWRAEVMVGTKDVLIRAADLVDDDQIYIRTGGFIEYTQLVFDAHQIIYAQDMPTESLHITAELMSELPSEMAHDVLNAFPSLPGAMPKPSRIPLETHDAQNLLRQIGRLSPNAHQPA